MNSIIISNPTETDTGREFAVQVDGREFVVRVSEEYYSELTDGEVDPAELVEASFEFLLEREPAGAILPEFNLRDIEKYFPEYPEVVKARF